MFNLRHPKLYHVIRPYARPSTYASNICGSERLWLHAYSRSSLIQAGHWVADTETRNSQSQFRALTCAALAHMGDLSQRHKLQHRSASLPLTERRLSLPVSKRGSANPEGECTASGQQNCPAK